MKVFIAMTIYIRITLLCVLVAPPALCQELGSGTRGNGADGPSPGAQMVREFEKAAPRVGDTLPDVRIWDDQGRPIDLGSLKGDYTVLVFGCLT